MLGRDTCLSLLWKPRHPKLNSETFEMEAADHPGAVKNWRTAYAQNNKESA
jgi:hypothetical protein